MPNMWQSVQTTDSSCRTPQILCRWEILVSKCCKARSKENNHLSTSQKNICHPKRMNMFKPNVQDLLQFRSAVMCSFVAWTQVCYLATAKKVSKKLLALCYDRLLLGFRRPLLQAKADSWAELLVLSDPTMLGPLGSEPGSVAGIIMLWWGLILTRAFWTSLSDSHWQFGSIRTAAPDFELMLQPDLCCKLGCFWHLVSAQALALWVYELGYCDGSVVLNLCFAAKCMNSRNNFSLPFPYNLSLSRPQEMKGNELCSPKLTQSNKGSTQGEKRNEFVPQGFLWRSLSRPFSQFPSSSFILKFAPALGCKHWYPLLVSCCKVLRFMITWFPVQARVCLLLLLLRRARERKSKIKQEKARTIYIYV